MDSQTGRDVSSKPTEGRGRRRMRRVGLSLQCAAFSKILQMHRSAGFSHLHAVKVTKRSPLKAFRPADDLLLLLRAGVLCVCVPGAVCMESVYFGPAHSCVANPLF